MYIFDLESKNLKSDLSELFLSIFRYFNTHGCDSNDRCLSIKVFFIPANYKITHKLDGRKTKYSVAMSYFLDLINYANL
ncbi:hypothetical protein BpHYR1_039183 [Brachionus plicatilis]|uniref:Uncharacterized protein n=1 Tax=Brachionus plicatilis TaxID=10195 RepID=A0A3M7PAS6_BRAPC|nr:hypothetical protein BpHYR1_039183 [Brachionus plicatilis]